MHLALLTVAPLFLHAFCRPSTHAAILAWLSAFGAMWIVMNPSPRFGEWPRDARHRIGWELVHDPFLTFCAVALLFAVVRAVNGGVAIAYSAAAGLWQLTGPVVPLLPGSVSGQGGLPLAGTVGVAVVILGVRHALGTRARLAYLLTSALLAALAVVCWHLLSAHQVAIPRLSSVPSDPFALGSLLGVFFLLATVAWAESWSFGSAALELSAAVAVAILLAGLFLYAPTFSLWVFALAGVSVLAVGAFLGALRQPSSAWFRMALALAVVLVPSVLLFFEADSRPSLWPLFPEGFAALRDAATAVALDGWRGATRMGLGLGAYPLALGFFATPENWQVLSDAQTAAPDGWVHFLFERGFLGCAMLALGLGILLRDGILRYVRAGSGWSLAASHLLGPVVLLAVIAVTFVECSYVQIDALMPVGAALGLTAASFPNVSEAENG